MCSEVVNLVCNPSPPRRLRVCDVGLGQEGSDQRTCVRDLKTLEPTK